MFEAIKKINKLANNSIPFLFIIDFMLDEPIVLSLTEIDKDIYFDINGKTNYNYTNEKLDKVVSFEKEIITFSEYITAFDNVLRHLFLGNSFLVNLTFQTPIYTNLSLEEIFNYSNAKYKLLYKNKFVVFSPEIFVKIIKNKIYSYPMKGTIDASIPDAENIILNNEKEIAEHYTIVDLIRNDLSIIARNVRVERFRYIDNLKTNNKNLLQVSSEIVGELEKEWKSKLGDIIFGLLPAGSISGAPKKKTIEIILESENYKRGYYTGIFGIFDGENLESGVMIRFIENIDGQLFFKSGGGITYQSDAILEYKEYADKIYVPII